MKIKEIINLVYIDDDRDEAISSYLRKKEQKWTIQIYRL